MIIQFNNHTAILFFFFFINIFNYILNFVGNLEEKNLWLWQKYSIDPIPSKWFKIPWKTHGKQFENHLVVTVPMALDWNRWLTQTFQRWKEAIISDEFIWSQDEWLTAKWKWITNQWKCDFTDSLWAYELVTTNCWSYRKIFMLKRKEKIQSWYLYGTFIDTLRLTLFAY